MDVSRVPASDVLREFIDKPVAMTVPRDIAAAFAGPRWLRLIRQGPVSSRERRAGGGAIRYD